MFDPQTFLDAAWTERSRAWFDKARDRIAEIARALSG